MADEGMMGFTWGFIDEIAWWSLGLATATAVLVGLIVQSVVFAAWCVGVALVDIVFVYVASRRGRRALEAGRVDALAPSLILAGRPILKAVLLVVALLVSPGPGFAGAVVGALIFDTTLALVGGALAAKRSMGTPREGR